MPALRYLIAFVTAALIIGGGAAFCAYTRQAFIDLVLEGLRKPENAEFATPELIADLEAGKPPHDMGLMLPSSLMWKINLSDIFSRYWLFLSLIVFAGCFLVAYLTGRKSAAAV